MKSLLKIGNFVFNLMPPEEPHKYQLGFPITPEDEERMLMACIGAARFMRGYGKGSTPYSVSVTDSEQIIKSHERR